MATDSAAVARAPGDAALATAPGRPPVGIWVGPCLVAVVLVGLTGVTGVRGADYPAHEFRAIFWRESPGSLLNFGWYGGHSVSSYGLLSPPVVSWLGAYPTVGLATVVATWAFSELVVGALPRRSATVAGCAFAVTAVVDVVVGRVAFAVGLALALVALRAWQRQRVAGALVASVLTSLASPVAGVCLILAAGAVVAGSLRGTDDRPVRQERAVVGIMIAIVTATPVAVTTVLFGGEGVFPFRGGHLALAVGVLALAATIVPVREVRLGCALAAVVSIAIFVVPNPLGGNIVRLPQIAVVPLLVAVAAGLTPWRGSRRGGSRVGWARRVAAAIGIAWSIAPAGVAAAVWAGDPSVVRDYHDALIEEVTRRNGSGRPLGRVEVPFTANHWESAWVASKVPYARGWERQIDLARNPELYDPALDVESYRRWLAQNAVRWIAVPQAPLDHGGQAEARLVAQADHDRADWLRRVWHNADWVLYEVDGYRPIVGHGAELIHADLDELVIRVDVPGEIDVRVVHSARLAIAPAGCLTRADDGLVRVEVVSTGVYRITSALWDSRRSQSADCAPS